MIHLGLIGYPLGHSLSPKIHTAALKAAGLEGDYSLFSIHPDDMQGLKELLACVRSREILGLNVTIPHKQNVIPLLDDLTPSARSIGAVNTIFFKDGKLIGHNTDAPGFLGDIQRCFPSLQAPGHALVLGAGGAARAVVSALLSSGWQVTLAVRPADVGQAEALISSFNQDGLRNFVEMTAEGLSSLSGGMKLIVNATPLGMSPASNTCPLPEDFPFPTGAVVYDCVYNPRETLLVKRARSAGLPAETGLGMLIEQAALAFEIWTGHNPPRDILRTATDD
ncbi:MAG: shikimate dehydrogenase [Chloroflexi bacterium]|nr:shikimate dehydrogenase [Chloroflexota bacterium]